MACTLLRALRILVATGLAIVTAAAYAHKPSDSYLTLHVEASEVRGQWDIALRDLDLAVGLDADRNGAITWGEVRSRHSEIAAYALSRLALSADGVHCPANVAEHLIDRHSDGAYAVLRFDAHCSVEVSQLSVTYRLLFDLDPQHRGLLQVERAGATHTAIFAPETSTRDLMLTEPDRLRQFAAYVLHGVTHIWLGFDHILFLLSLLLPAVLTRKEGRWQPATDLRGAFWEVLKVVTAFTLAHSITLTLAALGVVTMPSRWVESAIAASVVLAALNNLWPLLGERRWMFAFGFGLIHGFGFAGVLADLGLPRSALLVCLVAFNLGVELGQLAIVALFIPLAWWLRPSWVYRRVTLYAGSTAVALLAFAWLLERAFDWKLMS